MKRLTALLLALIMLFGLCACKDTGEAKPDEYDIEREAGCNKLTFYWNYPDADYSTCDMWIWYPNKDGRGYPFHPCE
ncbi:MAG: hypothetical protein J6P98_06210, partial [Clostridia bacterium]|nr:hypothetical protein [Clostridia bacterium]